MGVYLVQALGMEEWLTESMRDESRTGRWGQTRQASLPLGSLLKESGVEGDEDPETGSMSSSTRRFRCCASRPQLSPPDTLMPPSSPSLRRSPEGRGSGSCLWPTSSAWYDACLLGLLEKNGL
jgi:hypothetical protein